MTKTQNFSATEEKIMDAALKIFARRGFDAATTRAIAEESGFTEMTLFRKFETKKNLFNKVIKRGNKKVEEDMSLLSEVEYTREALESFIKSWDEFVNKNFEYFHLTVTEDTGTAKSMMDIITDYVDEYTKQLEGKVDYYSIGYSVSTFIYSLNVNRYNGRKISFGDYNNRLEELTNILYCMLVNRN